MKALLLSDKVIHCAFLEICLEKSMFVIDPYIRYESRNCTGHTVYKEYTRDMISGMMEGWDSSVMVYRRTKYQVTKIRR